MTDHATVRKLAHGAPDYADPHRDAECRCERCGLARRAYAAGVKSQRDELGKLRQQLAEHVASCERILSVLDGSENPDG